MVGLPKTLYDLRKVEASVRVTCPACKTVKMYDREEMIHSRRFQRRPMEWEAAQQDQICVSCDNRVMNVDFVPFGQNDRELREHRARALLMNLSLVVLQDASRRASADDVCTPAVRLALRVLRPFLTNRAVLVRFWDEAKEAKGRAVNHSGLAVNWIVTELVQRGHPVWAEFR